jgi:hypothetical protein
MILKDRELVNLSSRKNKNLLGHISKYEKRNGNTYEVFFIEERYFGFKETDRSGKIIEEGRMHSEYDYLLDRFFEMKERRISCNF